MAGKELLQKIKLKAGLSSSPPETGKGKGKKMKHITHGFNLVKGKSAHAMEDYLVSEFRQVVDDELGLFAIFDGHMGHDVANYLRNNLFDNILKEVGCNREFLAAEVLLSCCEQKDFWSDTQAAIKRAYHKTDVEILEKALDLGRGGSTAVTAILINGQLLVVANVGDSRAIMCQNGQAEQLSVDHEPSREKDVIESRGGFVTNLPGDVPRVDGRLAVARAFGDKSLKIHLSSEPDVEMTLVDDKTEFLILASDGLWKVMTNREAVECVKNVKDAQAAAKRLTDEAVLRKSKDDISVIVVRALCWHPWLVDSLQQLAFFGDDFGITGVGLAFLSGLPAYAGCLSVTLS
ncbi:hypothetical protein V2J09_020890 [Rumex salicifolius]